jgi:hypothetical protein
VSVSSDHRRFLREDPLCPLEVRAHREERPAAGKEDPEWNGKEAGMAGALQLYFAYGSNLDVAQMRLRCLEPRILGRATLSGYRLVFAGRSVRWEGRGMATLVPVPGAWVDGVLYALSGRDVEELDDWEAFTTGYEHHPVVVRDEQGREVKAFVYMKRSGALRPNPPGARYLGVLRREYERLGFDMAPLELAARVAA